MARAAVRKEARNLENPRVPVSAQDFWDGFGMPGWGMSASGVAVNIDNALGVPAVWAAVNFISGAMASLPLPVYKGRGEKRRRVSGVLANLLNEAINDECTSFQWRKSFFEQVLTGGRAFTFIERNQAGSIMALWPLDPNYVKVERQNGKRRYVYVEPGSTGVVYAASEVIDLAFALKPDGLQHRGPVASNADVIGMAISATQYASKYFQNGGVPPFAITAKFETAGALKRAGADFEEVVRKAAKDKRLALMLPVGTEIKPIGSNLAESQLIESQRFLIEQIARIYSLPPVFLQDLTHGTFTNTEQQDLQLVKHTLTRWAAQFEQELNLKLFGRASNIQWAELNMDGLLRGDFKTRMEGMARAVQSALITPNEGRALENRPPLEGGDDLYIQGATVPLAKAGAMPALPAPPASPATDPAPDASGDSQDQTDPGASDGA